MPELTIEEQLARYGEAAESRAAEHPIIDLHPVASDASADRQWIPSIAALLAALALGTAVVASAADRSTPVATEPAPTGATARSAPVEIEWWRARVDGPSGLVLSFVGGLPETDSMEPCQVEYRPEVAETDAEVTISIQGEPLYEPGSGCVSERGSRGLSVELDAPLGDRTVRNHRGEVIELWDHSTLRNPRWLPGGFEGWSLTGEAEYDIDVSPPRPTAWGRTWTADTLADDRCDGSARLSVSISQGPPEAVFPGPSQLRPYGIGERLIRGVVGIEGISDSAAMGLISRALWWQEGDVAFMISASRPCDEAEPLSFDDLARIAENLE